MPTQRPFLGSFLAAFRAHSQPLSKSTPSVSTSAAAAGSVTLWTSAPQKSPPSPGPEQTMSSPKPINTKSIPYNAQTSTATQDKQFVTSLSPLQHNVSPQTHLPRSPPSPGIPIYGPQNKSQPSYPSVQDVRRSRRGSDSSCDSGGFREVRPAAGEKWFIGGLTATGEEKYYKLSMIKRDPSLDRISTDQMSL